jgi:hypothetical protein
MVPAGQPAPLAYTEEEATLIAPLKTASERPPAYQPASGPLHAAPYSRQPTYNPPVPQSAPIPAEQPAPPPVVPVPAEQRVPSVPAPEAVASVRPPSPQAQQAPLPGVEGGSRFPSSITIRVPKVRREHLIAITSVAATLALVGIFSFVTRPEGSRARSEFLGGERTESTTSTEKKAAAPPAASISVPVVAAPTVAAAPTATTDPTPTPAPTSAPTPTTLSIASLPASTHGRQPAPGGGPLPTPTPAVVESPPPSRPEPPTSSGGGSGMGTISIVCRPACDSVFVKGRHMGPSPILGAAMPVGSHLVVLKRSGSPNKTAVITVTEGKNTPLRVEM